MSLRNYVPAVVDEVYVYNRALTQGEIAQLMNPAAADLKTWYHIGTSYYIDGWVDLGYESYYDRVAQVFSPPREWSVNTISLYAGEGLGLMAKNKTREDQNKTKVTTAYIQVELRSGDPYGELLASGSLYVAYPNWYDASLDNAVTLSPGNQYCVVAYSPFMNDWHIYYQNDGNPDDDGGAYRRRYVWPQNWEYMAVDLMVRYRAEYTTDATRMEHLNSLARNREPLLKYYSNEPYFPCDFYFDKEMDIRNNDVNYDSRGSNLWYDDNYRVFIHIEEYIFHDTLGLDEKPMIAIEYWYYYAYDEDPTTWHYHDFEMHCIVFLDQSTEEVLLFGMAHHYGIDYYDTGYVWRDPSGHPICYCRLGKHSAYPRPEGESNELSYNAVLEVYVLDTVPYTTTWPHEWGTFCDVSDWWGPHVRWSCSEGGWADSQHNPAYWWPWEFPSGNPPWPGVGPTPWRRY